MSQVSQENKIQGYLKPCLHKFIVKYSEIYQMSESKAVNQAVRTLMDSIPKDIQEKIVRGVPKNGY